MIKAVPRVPKMVQGRDIAACTPTERQLHNRRRNRMIRRQGKQQIVNDLTVHARDAADERHLTRLENWYAEEMAYGLYYYD